MFASAIVAAALALHQGRPSRPMYGSAGPDEGPLVLTGRDAGAARNASVVALPGWGFRSYSGFFTTQEATGNEMFFWYFPAQCTGCEKAPLLIWLQGGPGGSSLFGLFAEMGPFGLTNSTADPRLRLVPRAASWNTRYAMLFIDNPVGAGFSFTEDAAGYCKDTKGCVARNLYSLLQQFYQVWPEQLGNELYITGESYGGHYVPAFAAYIDTQNDALRKRGPVAAPPRARVAVGAAPSAVVPLAGMAIGDGWIDPVTMVPGYADMMYNLGLIDEAQRAAVRGFTDSTVAYIKAGQMAAAFRVWDRFLNGDIWPYGNYFHNATGLNDYDNYMNTNAPKSFDWYADYVNRPDVRRALHVGNATFNDGKACEMHLVADFMISLRDEFVQVLTAAHAASGAPKYKVLVYSGQLDIIIGAALTERFLAALPWAGQQAYLAAPRAVWRIDPADEEVAGYARQVGAFTQVVVRAAGHIVPGDQPERAFDMIDRFVRGRPYENWPDPRRKGE